MKKTVVLALLMGLIISVNPANANEEKKLKKLEEITVEDVCKIPCGIIKLTVGIIKFPFQLLEKVAK